MQNRTLTEAMWRIPRSTTARRFAFGQAAFLVSGFSEKPSKYSWMKLSTLPFKVLGMNRTAP